MQPRTAHYFYRLKDDNLVSQFCVANSGDPNQWVETMAPDGTMQRWQKREEGDLVVFYPPDALASQQVIGWAYNRDLQIGKPMPREELEKLALHHRVSVNFGA